MELPDPAPRARVALQRRRRCGPLVGPPVTGTTHHAEGIDPEGSDPVPTEEEVIMTTSATDEFVGAGRFLAKGEVSEDLRTVTKTGGRDADSFYRDRWSHDKVVRSTHGVNCTGSCSWKVYVKDGIITWETQQTDYPSVGVDSPEYEPRGCPRGAAFSVHLLTHPRALPLHPRRPP